MKNHQELGKLKNEMKLLKQEMNSKEARHLEEMKILKKNMKSIDSKYTTELNTLKDDIKTIKSILGSIQVRNLAKNFLNRYSIHLTDEDKKKYQQKKKRRALIAERGMGHLKDFNKDYMATDGFKSLIIIIESSLRIINEGNSFAHSFNCLIDNDGKNLTKLYFLSKLNITYDYIKNCYEFLVNYFENDM